MTVTPKRKMFVGVSRFMLPVPRALSALGLNKSVSGARAKAARLSEEERRIHHFVVKETAVAPPIMGSKYDACVTHRPQKRHWRTAEAWQTQVDRFSGSSLLRP
jgi:hypothetical protein